MERYLDDASKQAIIGMAKVMKDRVDGIQKTANEFPAVHYQKLKLEKEKVEKVTKLLKLLETNTTTPYFPSGKLITLFFFL